MAFYRKRRVPPRIAEPVFSFIDCPRSREVWFGVRLHSSTMSSRVILLYLFRCARISSRS